MYGRDGHGYPYYTNRINGIDIDVMDAAQTSDYVFGEVYRRSIFAALTGEREGTCAVCVKKIDKMTGDTIRFLRTNKIDEDAYVTAGNGDARAMATEARYDSCSITCEGINVPFLVPDMYFGDINVTSRAMLADRRLYIQNTDRLINHYNYISDLSILNSIMWNNIGWNVPIGGRLHLAHGSNPNYSPYNNGEMPLKCRAVAGDLDDYARDGGSSLALTLHNVLGVRPDADTCMSANHIARLVGRAAGDCDGVDRIEPLTTSYDGMVWNDRYILVIDSAAAMQLRQDKYFQAAQKPFANMADRGQGSYLNNCAYLGRFMDVDVYEYKQMRDRYRIDYHEGDTVETYSWGFLMGVGAVGKGASDCSREVDYDRINRALMFSNAFVLGTGALRFPPPESAVLSDSAGLQNPLVENGIIHSFVRIK